ncbi:hypothetical protein PP175_21535 [Aneurinibacillus sp. Ricciae_BoGa-3]|uniref:hypothetical protein n=1 Tax=Aneurinibacillus sp. Ricciae_BoGa-3 TaxID=3022697 RepID=UPI002340F347|nr:hypothetical protein [Aneurinibacillus sp. Ricciae_BoGa-3]WCK53874.1 hypothetical protein PP175_21535 [Aneurinibacillus sp. Ricciae_BoGa-3]
MDPVETTIAEMRKKQFYWQNYSDMQQLTICEMMSLERWLYVAEIAPDLVAVSQS